MRIADRQRTVHDRSGNPDAIALSTTRPDAFASAAMSGNNYASVAGSTGKTSSLCATNGLLQRRHDKRRLSLVDKEQNKEYWQFQQRCTVSDASCLASFDITTFRPSGLQHLVRLGA
jgi:hypothetical protein